MTDPAPDRWSTLARARRRVTAPGPRRVSAGLIDQLLSSLTNFTLTIAVARSTPLRDVGTFSALFAAYLLLLGLSRALLAEPYVIRYAGRARHDEAGPRQAVLGGALTVGLSGGAAAAILALLLRGGVSATLMAFAVILPGLLVADAVRYVHFAAGEPSRAVIIDLVWSIVAIGAIAGAVATGEASISVFLVAWGAGAYAAMTVGLAQLGSGPKPRAAWAHVRAQRDLGLPLLGDFLVTQGWNQALVYGVAAVGGLTVLGTLRSAEILLGPLNVLSMGIAITFVPEGVRLRRRESGQLDRLIIGLAAALVLATVLWGSVLLALPERGGRFVLGANWLDARSVLFPAIVLRAAAECIQATKVGLRSARRPDRILRLQLGVLPPIVIATLVGAWWAGAYGALVGKAATTVMVAPLWWREYLTVGNDGRR